MVGAGKLLAIDCCNRALRGVSKGSVGSHVEFPAVGCCNGALRGVSKGSVRSRGKLVAVDCCNRALRGASKGSVRSRGKKSRRMSCRHRKNCYFPLAIRISICYSHNRTKDTIAVRT